MKQKNAKRQRPKHECIAQAHRTERNKQRQLLKRLNKAKQHGRTKEVAHLTHVLQNR